MIRRDTRKIPSTRSDKRLEFHRQIDVSFELGQQTLLCNQWHQAMGILFMISRSYLNFQHARRYSSPALPLPAHGVPKRLDSRHVLSASPNTKPCGSVSPANHLKSRATLSLKHQKRGKLVRYPVTMKSYYARSLTQKVKIYQLCPL